MKKHKVLLLLLTLTVVLFAATGCGGGSTSAPLELPDGFTTYENKEHKLSLHYPEDWAVLDASKDKNALVELFAEIYDSEDVDISVLEDLGIDFSVVTAIWYLLDEMDGDLIPSLSLTVSESGGIKPKNLKESSFHKEFQEALEGYYSQIVNGFATVENMTGKQMGKHYYVTYKYDMSAGNANFSAIQAMTVIGDMMYTLTFSTHKGQAGIPMDTLEHIMASLVVGK